jgi:hypothetical protein
MEAKFQNEIHGGTVQGWLQGDNNRLTINNYGGKPEQRTIPFLAPPLRRSELIGREAVLEELKELLLADKPDRATALAYLVGVGKSALALRLAYDGDVIGRYRDGVLWASLGPRPNISALLGSWGEALGMSEQDLGRLNTIDQRQQAIKTRIAMSRMLLVIDDAWEVKAANAFLLGGPSCVHVLTTRLPTVAWEFAQDGVVTIEPLSEDDGLKLLAELAPAVVASEPEEARKLVKRIGALPLGLVIVGRFLAHEGRTGRPRRVRAALDSMSSAAERLRLEAPKELLDASPNLPEGAHFSLLASIEMSEAALDDDARRVFRELAVFRPKPYSFDESAAGAVTGAETSTLDALEDAGLIEPVGPDTYALQPVIAQYARGHLNDETAEECHRRALDEVSEKLRAYEEGLRDVAPYLRQYRYEQPAWENLEDEFLFHVSHAEAESADLAFATAYLDGFFWWGCYVPSPYCERRLLQWKKCRKSMESQDWVNAFVTFGASYPTGWEKHGQGDWAAVEAALHRIRTLAGVDGELEALEDGELRHIRALTDLFLAHARRYLEPTSPDADAYYAEARELCNNEDDEWILPWIDYELGDLALERGDLAKARELARAALETAGESEPDDRDHEVIANCFRLLADAEWPTSPATAFENYALAVFYAYKFQGIPQPPDFYTQAFYREMTDRTAMRLEELWDGRQREAIDACTYLHEFWHEYWELATAEPPSPTVFEQALEAGARDELKKLLFPPEPTTETFGDEAWGEGVSNLIERMAAKVESPTIARASSRV